MAGSGRVPGKEAASGCLCLFRMWRREESGPGTGLWSDTDTEGGVTTGSYEQIKFHSWRFSEEQVKTFCSGSSWQMEVSVEQMDSKMGMHDWTT